MRFFRELGISAIGLNAQAASVAEEKIQKDVNRLRDGNFEHRIATVVGISHEDSRAMSKIKIV